MATTRIMPLHIGKGRTESRAISDIIDYVANPQKTDNGKLITSYGCDSRTADAEFLLAKRQYIAATGRVRGTDDVIAYHVRQSFRPGEITPEEANRLGIEFARRFTKGNHSFVVCTHIDKSHIHNHIIWSAVNMDCDRKFRNFWGSTRAVRRLSDTICIENGLSIVENPKPHGKSYNKWLGEQAKPSHREQLRVMIDRALEQKPADFDTLLQLLSEMGCEVSRRGKAIRLKAPGWKNVARMDDKLGAGYSETEIRAVLAGEKQHTPRKKSTVQPEPPKVNLLVDIQAKLQAGKGAGYARWAKVFNWTIQSWKKKRWRLPPITMSCQRRLRRRRNAWQRSPSCVPISLIMPRPARPMLPIARPVIPENFGRNMSKKFCSIRRQKMPLMRWE